MSRSLWAVSALLVLLFASLLGGAPSSAVVAHAHAARAAVATAVSGGNDCTPTCAVNFTWTANQTAPGDCPQSNQNCATQSHTYCLYHSCPGLDGEVVQVDWKDVEPTAGVYNFTTIDKQVNEWAAKGFAIGFYLIYVPDSGAGCSTTSNAQAMPDWLLQQHSFPTDCSTAPTGFKQYLYPLYCDPTFTADLDSFMATVANHYASSPYVGQIRFVSPGTGIGHENAEIRGGTSYSGYTWEQQHSCVTGNWASWVEARSDTWANDFSYTSLDGSYNTAWSNDPNADPCTGMTNLPWHEVYSYHSACEGGNHGLMLQNLTPKQTYAGITSVDHYLNAHLPSSVAPGDYLRSYETDPNVSSTNMAQYIQTAYCYTHGYPADKRGLTVSWYANIPQKSFAFTQMQNLHAYVNGTKTPSGGNASYCSGQAGY